MKRFTLSSQEEIPYEYELERFALVCPALLQ